MALPAATLFLLAGSNVLALETTGTPGSPSATTTISGNQLPPPAPKFGGVIKDDALQSKPWWPPRVVPPKDAPNILLIMTDDAGFGVPSTFGGVIPTPSMDRIAANGLRYNRIFSTSLCSPTRAALITGRNHHSVGFGVIAEQATGFPGYDSVIGVDNATIGRILRDNGYATSWFGKDHNTPTYQASQVGPFTQWPTGMGFDYFYGFVGGDANQWGPNLFRNTTQIYPWIGHEGTLKMDRSDPKAEIWPVTGKEPSWNLITAMADDAIDWMYRIHQTDPSQPIFLYYVPGASHAPHHPTKEWVDKIHAMHLFDDGYEKLRERIFANQKKLGVIPQDEELTPWPSDILTPWDKLIARGEEALHPAGRGVRRLRGLQRPRDRPGDSGVRGPGQARQHADHLPERRQRHQRRRRAGRHVQRGRVLQRRPPAGGRADEVLRRLGHRIRLQPHVGGLVVGL